jgi:hypothetical protein
MYSFTQSGTVPGIYVVPGVYAYNTGTPTDFGTAKATGALLTSSNYGQAVPVSALTNTLSASIATQLSVIPVASPASAVITRKDSASGAELPVSSTLGPIFTERGETIGKHKFYVGISNQDFHFTSLNGQSLRSLQLLAPGGSQTGLTTNGQTMTTYPVTVDIGVDVKLGQNVAFLTYGVTDRIDVSLGLPIVHSSISSATYNAQIWVGNGLGKLSSSNPNCWCLDTFTPGTPPTAASSGLGGLVLPGEINSASGSNSGFGDLLLRFKRTMVRQKNLALAAGADLRLPTGDEKNYLGTGATAIKPFLALSLYTTPFSNGIVFSPHANVGWQYSGKSILGGQLSASELNAGPPPSFGIPFGSSKGYLPDVFSWAIGTEVALGRHHTVVADILGNQIGWDHGISNMMSSTSAGFTPSTSCTTNASQCQTLVPGLVTTGPESVGQYSGAFGYKARIAGDLVGTFNMLVRFDNNGLVSRAVPLFGLSYTFF